MPSLLFRFGEMTLSPSDFTKIIVNGPTEDSECLMFDPVSKDLFLLTKTMFVDDVARLYTFTPPEEENMLGLDPMEAGIYIWREI